MWHNDFRRQMGLTHAIARAWGVGNRVRKSVATKRGQLHQCTNQRGNMVTLDHLKLIEGDLLELKKIRKFLLEAQPGGGDEVVTYHEADGSCCRRECWSAT